MTRTELDGAVRLRVRPAPDVPGATAPPQHGASGHEPPAAGPRTTGQEGRPRATGRGPAGRQGRRPDPNGRPRASAPSDASRPSRLAVAAFVAVLTATCLLSWSARRQDDANEKRLLKAQTDQAAVVLKTFVAARRTPLASAVAIAESSGGVGAAYPDYARQFLLREGGFVTVSLWRMTAQGTPRRVSTAGVTSRLSQDPARERTFLDSVARSTEVGVTGFLTGGDRRLGFGFAAGSGDTRYVVYAEDALSAPYRQRADPSSPFADLRYAMYLGRSTSTDQLLRTSESRLPLPGHTARSVVPFGSSSLTLVATSAGDLSGTWAGDRWWIIGGLGLLVAVAAGVGTDRLVKRRRQAEDLARENQGLLDHQRTISDSLQKALMPRGLPELPGVEIATRYCAGAHGIEIGGDWCDVIPVDDEHFAFVVGDVSGRGLDAGSVMASLHFAIRGFVGEGHDPATVLTLLTRLLELRRDRHFATVVCGLVDVARREVTLANAGHLPPLLVDDGHGEFVATEVGPPIGVRAGYPYAATTVAMPPGSVLLAFTDGLVERRGETIDDGLERLRSSATGGGVVLDDLVGTVLTDLTPGGTADDTALLGLRFLSGAAS